MATPYILVHLIEHREPGERFRKTRSDWPLHITLVPWFFVEYEQSAAFIEALQTYARQAGSFDAKVGAEHMFGPDKDIGVNVIANQSPLQQLHRDLKQVVELHSSGFRPNASIGSGVEMPYEAHITHHDVNGVIHQRHEGDIESVRDITLATYEDTGDGLVCEIVEHFVLDGKRV